mgnify:CR=1 FL=1
MRLAALTMVVFTLASNLAPGFSNISPTHKYAWCENLGWTNWLDAGNGGEGVRAGATFLSGYIWAENVGYINLGDGTPAAGSRYANADDTDFGVNIDANGDLYGYAWGENIGWVNFDTRDKGGERARLDRAAGRFRGYVWAENVGWMNLDDDEQYVALSSTADFDGDGDVDLVDFGVFQGCFNGPNRPPARSDCSRADFEGDGDVDLVDFGRFQACFNGPNRPPACP